MPILRLSRGEALKLYGPMSVTVTSGLIDVHGRLVQSGERFVIHKSRNYVIVAENDSELDISMIDESQIQVLEQDDPYNTKRALIEEIVRNPHIKLIVIIGCTDCGKTSLTTMLYNASIRSNRRPAVLDSDVGQADIGPPGFVTLGASSNTVYWISELKPIMMRFIGDIKPQTYSSLIIEEVCKLYDKAKERGFDVVVVDTDGWVKDERGIIHKLELIEALRPDVIVVLGEDLKGVFNSAKKLGTIVYEIPAPKSRKIRSREERKALRSLKYREYLENAKVVRLKLDNIYVSRLPLLQGVEIDPHTLGGLIEGEVQYTSRLPGAIYIYGDVKKQVQDEQKRYGVDLIKIYPVGFERSIYCSVGSFGDTDYPCLIEKIDFNSREVIVRTKYTGDINTLKFSKIKLTEAFIEEYIEV